MGCSEGGPKEWLVAWWSALALVSLACRSHHTAACVHVRPTSLLWLWCAVAHNCSLPPLPTGLPAPMQQDPPGIEPENESLETVRAVLQQGGSVEGTVSYGLFGHRCCWIQSGRAVAHVCTPSHCLGGFAAAPCQPDGWTRRSTISSAHPTRLPTQGTANPVAALKAKLDRLQRVGLTVQNVLDGVACAMERFGVRFG